MYKGLLVLREGEDHIWLKQSRHVSLEKITWCLWERWGSDSDMNWMFLSPQSSYVETLNPTMMVLGGGTFGRWWDHESGALVNEIRALLRGLRASSLSFHLWGHNKKTAICYQAEGHCQWIGWHLDLGLLGLQNCEK